MSETNLTGRTIKGYELLEQIGSGGFGAVYRAYQATVKREVAVKVILAEYANDPEFIRRFEAEAQLIANLEHIHIVPLYDYWRDQTGAYLVMRWYRGGSLHDVLKKGHWPIHDVVRVLDQLTAALAVAHRNNVVHRDIKPANILLDEAQNVYLADFGIAADLGHITDYATMLASQEASSDGFIGSPDYISPEQIREQPAGPQSDIYSMGLVVYELLTGVKPFGKVSISALISKHLTEPLPNIQEVRPDLTEELNQVIKKATEKDPANRYKDIIELAVEFRKAIAHTTPEALATLEQRTRSAIDLEALGLPPGFLDGDFDADFEPLNPYKGLRAFQEADADDFFGRERLVDSLLHRFREEGQTGRFLALIGPSGSGKSSLIRAGLLPKLRQGAVENSDHWFFVEMVPGSHPLEELEAALLRIAINPPASLLQQLGEDTRGLSRAIKRVLPADSYNESELVLFIDQFEEIFTMVEVEADRAHFLNSLAEAVRDSKGRLRVITTLRADFYDRPLLYPEFGQLMSECSTVVLPLSSDELQRAIIEPAERAGLVLDRGLVGEIINDVGEQPGTLPLLQYALTELYERRDQRRLTRQAYHDIGGVSGALARRADDIYDQLNETQQGAARQIFLRLVTLGEGVEDTRRRVTMPELFSLQVEDDTLQQVLDFFGKYRLLTFDNEPLTRTPTVELAHEALIRQWGLLRDWLSDSREDLRLQRRVAQSAQEWRTANEDTSYLASGTRLQQFEEWLSTTELALAEIERAYLDASLDERQRRRAQEAARKAYEATIEQRSRYILRVLVAVLAIATVGAMVLSAFAFNQQQRALNNAETAIAAQERAQLSEGEARSLAFISSAQLALTNNNTELAIRLALQANEDGESSIQTRRTLAEAAYAPGTRAIFNKHEGRVETVVFHPDGERGLSGGRDGTLILFDLASGAVLQRMSGHSDWILDVAISPNGQFAISASQDATLIVWDLQSGEARHTLQGHTEVVNAVAINGEGTQAVSGSSDGTIIFWDIARAELLSQSAALPFPIREVAFSPSGFTALSVGAEGAVVLWNTDRAEPLLTFGPGNGGHTEEIWSVAYTPDESGFITGAEDARILLWTFEAGQPILEFNGHNARVTSLAFSNDGRRIASGSEDNTVILWDATNGAPLHQFIGHSFLVYDVALSPDANQILSASWDGSVRYWDIHEGAQIKQLGNVETAHSDDVRSVDFSPNGDLAATASLDGRVILWDIANNEVLQRLQGHSAGVNVVRFSPDGTRLASGGNDNTMIVWDVASGAIVHELSGHSDGIWALDFTPDGTQIATGARDNTIILWDAIAGEQRNRLFGHTFRVTDVDFSPDGRQLVTSSFDTLLILWDVETGQEIRRYEGHGDWVWSAEFSPNGQTIVSGSADNSILLWDAQIGTQLRRYEGHTALVNEVRFSPDGRVLTSASDDGTIILWDLDSGQELQRFNGHTDAVKSVAFSPDGQRILSASDDDTARLWAVRLSLDALSVWIEANRQIRDFTCAERALYNVPPLCPEPTPVLIPGQRT